MRATADEKAGQVRRLKECHRAHEEEAGGRCGVFNKRPLPTRGPDGDGTKLLAGANHPRPV